MLRGVTSALQRNHDFLEEATEGDLCSWLLRGFRDPVFDPPLALDDVSVDEQLRDLFAGASGAAQEKLKGAVARGLNEWTCDAHGLALLSRLAYLAADIRASAALPRLRVIIDRGEIQHPDPEEVNSTLTTVLAVVGGFATLDEVALFIERLYVLPLFPSRFRPLLFTALCEHAPDRYAEYLPRLIEAIDQPHSTFVTAVIFRNIVDIVGFQTIAKHLASVDNGTRTRFLEFIAPIFYRANRSIDHETQNSLVYYFVQSSVPDGDIIKGDVQQQEGLETYTIPYNADPSIISELVYRNALMVGNGASLSEYVLQKRSPVPA